MYKETSSIVVFISSFFHLFFSSLAGTNPPYIFLINDIFFAIHSYDQSESFFFWNLKFHTISIKTTPHSNILIIILHSQIIQILGSILWLSPYYPDYLIQQEIEFLSLCFFCD